MQSWPAPIARLRYKEIMTARPGGRDRLHDRVAFAEQYQVATGFASDDVPRDLRSDVALCLYRITQESLRNIAQHAGEATVSVRLTVRRAKSC